MIGTVERIDYDGERVHSVVLRFPSREAPSGTMVKEITACEHIGQGSFGTVYRAYCDGYPRLALKISTGKATRLRQELEVLSKVCTKGKLVLPRFEFGALNKAADLIVIGMELCVPSTLHDLLLSTRITDEADMLFLGYQAAQAVACVHGEGCIHRDIKLQNFVFDVDGNLKLIDFGLSCSSLRPPAGDVVAGTVSFMSPEMAHNALHKDKRVSVGVAADIWSLGIVLFSIFTQRNPYPPDLTSKGGSHLSSSSSSSSSSAPHSSAARNNNNNNNNSSHAKEAEQPSASGRRALNERLLRRVAAGAWRWPPGCVLSDALRDLIMCTLVHDPARRPDINELLRKKVWTLRRRTPPSAVTAFLGVQDDILLLSRDSETHLMRAVEERSADMAASRVQSRIHSPRHSPGGNEEESSGEHTRNRNGREGDNEEERMRPANAATTSSAKMGHHEAEELALQTPTRPQGSLKVVVAEAAGEVDGGLPCVQVYDVRASTRKRSKPIRDIALVIAAETAKTRSRSRRNGLTARARVNSAEPRAAPPAPVRATAANNSSNNNYNNNKEQQEQDGEEVHVVEADDTFTTFTSTTTANATPQPLLSSTSALSSQAIVQTVKEDDEDEGMTRPAAPEKRGRSRHRAASAQSTSRIASAHGSMCLLDEDDNSDNVCTTSVPTTSTRAAAPLPAPTTSRKRARPASASRGKPHATRRAAAAAATPMNGTDLASRSHAAAQQTVLASGRLEDAGAVQKLLQLHSIVARMIALDQAWLHASLRLTIEEDQERYNMTWLAAEQAKSAAHPHRFKEVFQVTSKKYQYGFVCDQCDYEFLPGGRNGKALHFFHCLCGRDLCPECHAAYRTECTCPACRAVCANHIALREHRCPTRHKPGCTGNDEEQQQQQHVVGTRGGAHARKQSATTQHRRGRPHGEDTAVVDTKLSMAAMQQKVVPQTQSRHTKPATFSKAIDHIPAGPWQPFAKLRGERRDEAALQPSPEERELLLNGEWVRHCYLYPSDQAQEPYAFVYHIQPGRTGAIFLSDDFALHSAVFSMLERQFFAIDAVDLQDGEDTTRVTTLLRAKSHPDLAMSFRALQEIVAYDTNMLKQHRVMGTVSIYQAPRSAFSSSGQAFVYVRWFRFSEDGSLTAFMLSNGGVQVFVRNEYELRWFDEGRKFLVRCNGVCEMVDEDSFVLGPAINHLLYDTFDDDS